MRFCRCRASIGGPFERRRSADVVVARCAPLAIEHRREQVVALRKAARRRHRAAASGRIRADGDSARAPASATRFQRCPPLRRSAILPCHEDRRPLAPPRRRAPARRQYLPGVQVSSFTSALIAALVLGLLNTLLRPILVLLTLPVTLLTLGLFLFVINALMFYFAASLLEGFHVNGFGAALIGSILYSLCGLVIDAAMERLFRRI